MARRWSWCSGSGRRGPGGWGHAQGARDLGQGVEAQRVAGVRKMEGVGGGSGVAGVKGFQLLSVKEGEINQRYRIY